MLPKRHRLRSPRDIARVRRSGRAARGGLFTICAVPRRAGDAGPTRVAITVSRRVSRKATERNRITRWVRADLRRRLADLAGGHDVLVIARGGFPHYSRRACEEELPALLARLSLLPRA